MVRPSGLKQVELAQRTEPKSRVSFRSASSRQTEEIGREILLVHAAGDEAALPVGAAVVQPRLRQVRLERRDVVAPPAARIEEGKAVGEGRDHRAVAARREAADAIRARDSSARLRVAGS